MRLAFALLLFAAHAHAHAFNPTLLDVREVAPGRHRVTWKPQPRAATFPCVVTDGELACALEGKAISVDDLGDTDVLIRITRLDGSVTTSLLRRDAPSFTVPVRATPSVGGYLRLGIEHIFLGFDHLLFVLGLLLLVPRQLVRTLTAFTVAHSLTLALAVLGAVHVPQAPVEAAIALSLLLVAAELLRDRPSLARQKPWAVAFAFGLLHGLGFAGALGEIGLPPGQVAPALVCFNLGVELGQLAFVGVLVVAGRCGLRPGRRAPAYLIGSLAAFWCLERISGFWS